MNYDDYDAGNEITHQDNTRQNKTNNKPFNARKAPQKWFKFLIFFLIITGLEILIFYPHVHQTVKESGIITLIQQHKETKAGQTNSSYQVYFYTINDTLEHYQTTPIAGVDFNHGTFMALLAGPTKEAIKNLSFSYIPEGTTLRGISIAKGITYLDVSKDILTSPDLTKAFQQLQATADTLQKGNAFTLMIEGIPYKTEK